MLEHLTDQPETTEIWSADYSSDEEPSEELEQNNERSLLERWTDWANIIDRKKIGKTTGVNRRSDAYRNVAIPVAAADRLLDGAS